MAELWKHSTIKKAVNDNINENDIHLKQITANNNSVDIHSKIQILTHSKTK